MENKRQPSFNADWIKQKILVLGELSNLNNSARAVIFIVIETGAPEVKYLILHQTAST